MYWYTHPQSWSFILRRYLPRLALCSLAWEIAQLPLYTLWSESSPGQIAFAVAHCTAGDVMISTAALVLALIASRAAGPADWPRTRVVIFMVMLTLAYTFLSEWINLAQGNWAYSPWMPVLPWLGVGVAPLMQWIVVPLTAWRWASPSAMSVR